EELQQGRQPVDSKPEEQCINQVGGSTGGEEGQAEPDQPAKGEVLAAQGKEDQDGDQPEASGGGRQVGGQVDRGMRRLPAIPARQQARRVEGRGEQGTHRTLSVAPREGPAARRWREGHLSIAYALRQPLASERLGGARSLLFRDQRGQERLAPA